VEDVVDLPFPRQREADGERGDDFLNLKGTVVFVVQFLRRAARPNVASAEHDQVSHLIGWRWLSAWVGVQSHSFLSLL